MKIGFSTKSSEWIFRAEAKLPQQTNSYDCGVFICFFAKIISYSYKILSNQLLDSHIIDFRKRMFEEIQKFELLDNDFNYATEFNLKKH
jgi:Ulp1 family protease